MSTSYTSQTSLGLSFSLADKNASISKAFLSSASAVYLKLGCLVMSYLSERKGRTPRSWRMHLFPSIVASSSWLISSLPHCQMINSKIGTINENYAFMVPVLIHLFWGIESKLTSHLSYALSMLVNSLCCYNYHSCMHTLFSLLFIALHLFIINSH